MTAPFITGQMRPRPRGHYMSALLRCGLTYEGFVTTGTWCDAPFVFVRDRDDVLIAMFQPVQIAVLTPALDPALTPAALARTRRVLPCGCGPTEVCDLCARIEPRDDTAVLPAVTPAGW